MNWMQRVIRWAILAVGVLAVAGILVGLTATGVIGPGGDANNQGVSVQQPTTTPTATATGTRQTTGQGQTLPFSAGASVIGFRIALSSGTTLNECYLASAPLGGTVTDGVIWPNQQEVAQATACTGAPSGGVSQTTGNVPAYGQPPQPQIGHPSLYVETGVNNHTQTWSIPVDSDKVLIVGGFSIDGVGGGVYKAYPGGQTVTVTVTDGFASVIKKEWGNNEFCFRVSQAVQFGWAHNTVTPLLGWNCPAK